MSWTDPVTLCPSELTQGDHFGTSVAISDDVAVVGAINQGPFGSRTGSVYVFKRIGDDWIEIGKLRPEDGVPGDEFGHAVAIDGKWDRRRRMVPRFVHGLSLRLQDPFAHVHPRRRQS